MLLSSKERCVPTFRCQMCVQNRRSVRTVWLLKDSSTSNPLQSCKPPRCIVNPMPRDFKLYPTSLSRLPHLHIEHTRPKVRHPKMGKVSGSWRGEAWRKYTHTHTHTHTRARARAHTQSARVPCSGNVFKSYSRH